MKTREQKLKENEWLLTRPIAHRGLADTQGFLENTEKAFKNSIEKGYPIETDLRYTLDKKIVCIHDSNPKRVGGPDVEISSLTADEVKKITLSDGSKIMFFEEFLALVDGKVPLLIEIKHPVEKTIERDAIEILKGYTGKFALQSFDPKSLLRIKKLAPDILRGQLIGGSNEKPKTEDFKWSIVNKFTKPDFLSYNIDTFHKAYSIPTVCWTVRDSSAIEKALKWNLNIITEGMGEEYLQKKEKKYD